MSVLEVAPHRPSIEAPIGTSAAEPLCNPTEVVAHHFESAAQQYDAAKLGMWIFLGTEVLLFGGLFVLYAVLRSNNPEVFHYGSQFLDMRLGAANTILLILSSMTMAVAVHAAQRGAWRLLITCLIATVVGGAGFMAIKYVEYSHKIHEGLVLGPSFYAAPEWALQQQALAEGAEGAPPTAVPVTTAAPANATSAAVAVTTAAPANAPTAAPAAPTVMVPAAVVSAGDAEKGRAVWDSTCRTCHGASGEGLPGSGKPIKGSPFVNEQTDAQLLKFLKVGRAPSDPLNTTGSQMPPKGGNPLLKDADLKNVIAFVRTMAGSPAAGTTTTATTTAATAAPAVGATAAATVAAPKAPEPFWIPKSSIPNAPDGPSGISEAYSASATAASLSAEIFPHHAVDTNRPVNAHQFFAIYYLMTGLHGIHVLIGMLVIGTLAVLAMRGRFGPRSYTMVDMGGLYWHLVDLIWIFLFPLFYLL